MIPVVSVVCSLTPGQSAPDFKSLEEQIVETVQASAREFYAQAAAADEVSPDSHAAEFRGVRALLVASGEVISNPAHAGTVHRGPESLS